MTTLLNSLDLASLVLLIAHLTRTVKVSGSVLLSIFAALFVIVFAIVSLGAYVGLISGSSLFITVISLLVLIAMVSVIGSSWRSKPAA